MVQFDATKVSSVSVICKVKVWAGRKDYAQRLGERGFTIMVQGDRLVPWLAYPLLPLCTILTIIHGTVLISLMVLGSPICLR